jgi:hypothetical protein
MNLIERARSIIVNPGPTWAAIEQESTDWQKLYVPYMVVLAAIPAVAGFIGWSVLGMGGFGMSMRIPVLTGLGMMVTQYIMTLVMVFVWGWLISLLASTFGGQANLMNAVKLSVYSSTAAMLAGIFSVLPSLSILVLLGSGYSLYLAYLGLPVLMKNPKEKSLPYLVVVAVAGIVGTVLISYFSAALMPSPMPRMHGTNEVGDFKISTPKGDVEISTAPGKSAAAGDAAMTIKTPDGEVTIDAKKMEEFAKQMEAIAAAQEAKK